MIYNIISYFYHIVLIIFSLFITYYSNNYVIITINLCLLTFFLFKYKMVILKGFYIMKKRNLSLNIIFILTFIFTCSFSLKTINAQSYRYPLEDTKAHVTSPYGWRIHPIYGTKKFHAGVDLVCDSKYILAAKTGTVIETGYDSGRGNYVILQHSDNKDRSTYMHMSSIYVKKNQSIKQGQIIGYMGATGAATGVHLHFQVNKAPNYSSTAEVNPNKLKYTYNKNHTHVYNKYGVQDTKKHPHVLIGKCICGKLAKTTASTEKKYGLAKGCKKCLPVITSKYKAKTTSKSMKVKWSKVKNANSYKYYLYSVPKEYATFFPTLSGSTTKNEVTFTNLLPGEYKVFIQAIDSKYGTKSSASAQTVFYVDLPKYTPKKSIIADNKIYSLFEVSSSWKYSENICKRLGGHLAILSNSTRNTSVINMIKKYGKKDYYFIGATDEKKQGTFKWVDGTKFSYKAFAKGQPSDEYKDRPYIREDYLAIDTNKNYGWNDLSNFSTAEKKASTANKGFILQTDIPKAPAAPNIRLEQQGADNIIISWNKVNANKYLVYYSASENGKYTKLGETTSTNMTAKKLKFGQTYYFKVIGYATKFEFSAKGKYSEVKNIQIKPSNITALSIKDSPGSNVNIKYNKSYNATAYEVYRSTVKDRNYKKIGVTNKDNFTDKVKKDKFYYYKIRPYYKNQNTIIYGNYSYAVCIKYIKKPSTVKGIKITKGKNYAVKIKYSKSSYAKGYQIYRSNYKDKKFKRIATTSKLSYIDKSKKKKNKPYYYKVRAYNKIENVTSYGNYSKVKGAKFK